MSPIDAVSAAMAAALLALAAVLIRLVQRRRPVAGAGAVDPLSPGPAILIEDGIAIRLSAAAAELPGIAEGARVRPGLEALLGEGAAEAMGLVDQATRSGEPAERVLTDVSGRSRLLRVGPVGARVRLAIDDLDALTALAEAPRDPVPDGLASLIESAPILAWQRTPGGSVVWAAGSIAAGTGAVRAEAVAAMLASGAAGRAAEREDDGAGLRRLRLEMEAAPGERVPLLACERAGEDGVLSGFATDAGQLVAAERTLTRFVQTMTETFAHLTVGLAIFDSNRRLALFNPTIVSIWDLSPGWLAERPTLREIIDALRANRRLPEFRDFHDWRKRLLQLLDDPESADYEELWSLSDGRTIRVLARPHPHGSLAFMFDDVTERIRLEQRNRSMDDLFRTTLDRLHEGIVVFNPNGQLRYVNDSFHAIWDTDAAAIALDMHVRDLVTLTRRLSRDTDVWERFLSFATGEAGRSSWTSRIVLGSGRMLATRFAPLPDGSTMAVFADVTDTERIAAALGERNEALEAAERMRRAVLDQISHRLRTPLNSVLGFGELIATGKAGPLTEMQQQYADGLLEGTAQLLDTIGEVTELASLQLDPREGESPEHSVEEVIEVTRDLLERRALDQRVNLAVEVEGAIGTVACADARLRQIVFSLVSDAIQRCPKRGTVTLRAARGADGTVEIGTREPVDPAAGDPVARLESESVALSLVRRLIAEKEGRVEVAPLAYPPRLAVTCHVPDAEAAAALPDAGAAG